MAVLTGELGPVLTWNLVDDVRQMLVYPFMVNAFRAGAVVAVLSGLVGWFMVLRRQSFVGHTLALVGFPGAAGAVLVGASAAYGMFAFAVAAALVIAAVPRFGIGGYAEESAVTGTVQAFALACGFLFVSLYGGFLSGTNALLFGTFLGITASQVVVLTLVAAVALVVLGVVARPLLFASVDPDVAAARGLPVRALSAVFLVLLGATAAEVSQITGTLLVFALLVVPAATAQTLTPRAGRSAALTVVLGVGITWLSLSVAFYAAQLPIGFVLTSVAFAAYVGARLAVWGRRAYGRRSRPELPATPAVGAAA
jgi:zinc/manganese transport system permease protein